MAYELQLLKMKKNMKRGFSLIELLIVIFIIGVLAAILIPNLLVSLQKGKQKSTIGDMHSIGIAIESYISDVSSAPVSNGTIRNSLNRDWFVPFFIKTLPITDSWGTDFQYQSRNNNKESYSVISFGKDKKSGPNPPTRFYSVTKLSDFNFDIIFSNGQFSQIPKKPHWQFLSLKRT